MKKEKMIDYDLEMSENTPMWKKVIYTILAILSTIFFATVFFAVIMMILLIGTAIVILLYSWFPALICWSVWSFIAPVKLAMNYWTWLGIVIIAKSLFGGFKDTNSKVTEMLKKLDDKLNIKLTNIKS